MTNEEIKLECEQMYAQIKNAEIRLGNARSICKHEKTFRGTYSWRVGAYQVTDVCEYCGEPVGLKQWYKIEETEP